METLIKTWGRKFRTLKSKHSISFFHLQFALSHQCLPIIAVFSVIYLFYSKIISFLITGVCKKLVFQPSLTSKLLQNHVILTVSVTKESDCEVQCYLDNRCLSYNYIQSTKTCQLSDSDAHIDSKDLVTDVYSIYRGTKVCDYACVY